MRQSLGKYSKEIALISPLLVLYIGIVLLFSTGDLVGDEIRHMNYATNLTQGFYTDASNPEFVNGPGYPLVLAVFSLSKISYTMMKLANAIFLVLGVFLFFKTLSLFFNPKQALLFSYIFGLYPPLLKWLVYLVSEPFSIFLVCGFLYFFMKLHANAHNRNVNILLAGLFLGLLTLTKVIFGYVILAAMIFYAFVLLLQRSKKILASMLVLAVAFILCIPYLAYTYSLTGEALYWGSGGGEILYWRSSPYPNEYGDWISKDVVFGHRSDDYFDTSTIAKNHLAFFQSVEPYSIIERDRLLKQKAIENIKENPIKYLQNTAASGMRLFFNYPYSYTQQKPTSYFYILPNGLLLFFLLLAIYLALKNPKAIAFELRFIGIISMICIGGLVMANGMVRYILPLIPLLLFFIAFVIIRVAGINNIRVFTQISR